jgi:hypothetical protein
MKEKILEALKLKFTGVSDATLERIAAKKVVSVKEESDIPALIEAMTFDTIIQSETDYKITEANRKAVENYEVKHGLKDGKPLETKKPVGRPKKDSDSDEPEPNDIQKMITDAIAAAITPLQQKIEVQEQEKTSVALAEKVSKHEKLKDIPQSYLKGRNLVPKSEAEIDQLVASIETDYNGFKQEMAEKGVVISVPPAGGGPAGDKVTIQDYLADKFPDVENVKK